MDTQIPSIWRENKKSTGDLTFTNRGKQAYFSGMITVIGLMKIVTKEVIYIIMFYYPHLRPNVSLPSVCLVYLST